MKRIREKTKQICQKTQENSLQILWICQLKTRFFATCSIWLKVFRKSRSKKLKPFPFKQNTTLGISETLTLSTRNGLVYRKCSKKPENTKTYLLLATWALVGCEQSGKRPPWCNFLVGNLCTFSSCSEGPRLARTCLRRDWIYRVVTNTIFSFLFFYNWRFYLTEPKLSASFFLCS